MSAVDAAVSALFINSGILGQRTFADFVRTAFERSAPAYVRCRHWSPTLSRPASDEFAAQLSRRGAYHLMSGLPGESLAEISITAMLFDSWLVSNCPDLGDRVSMSSSAETRVPLLETGVIDTAVGLWRHGRREDAQGHKTWLRAIARDLLPADYVERPKLGFVTPTLEWTQAVNARYGGLVDGGMLCQAHVVDPGRLRAWARRSRPGIRREFLLYKLTLLELWCRIVIGGERPERLSGID